MEGQSVTFSCTPTPDSLMVGWTMNGHIINSSEHITLSPEHLHHTITIKNVVTADSGEYFCFTAELVDSSINKTITLNVLQGNSVYTYVCVVLYFVLHYYVPYSLSTKLHWRNLME